MFWKIFEMKIDIINDNEINIIFTISDSSPEINLPKLDNNDLLVESRNKLRKLSKNEIDKLFLNNKENLKIYIFPVDINGKAIESHLFSLANFRDLA